MLFNNKEKFTELNGVIYVLSLSGNEIYITGYSPTINITNLSIPQTIDNKNVIEISDNAFIGANINKLTIPNTITSIGENSFSNITMLTEVIINNDSQLYKIKGKAFFNTGINSINIPKLVNNIDAFAFSSISNLATVYFQGDKPIFGTDVFTNSNTSAIGYHKKLPKWDDYRKTSNKIDSLTLEYFPESSSTSILPTLSTSSSSISSSTSTSSQLPIIIISGAVISILIMILLKIFVI